MSVIEIFHQLWLARLRYLFADQRNYSPQTRSVALQHFRGGITDFSDLQDVRVFVSAQNRLAADAAGELNWRFHS